jgi:DNA (cytosine-5)-methyltransferase 1
MKFVELFAGIGGFSIGLEAAGHECVGQCEIDPHARSVLDRHWPNVPKHDDVATLQHDTFPHPQLVTFGSPCQDLSVAGKRAGMVDGETRSGLFYEAVRYIRDIQEATNGSLPEFALWENVPGAYSSNGGADFATVLTLLVGGEVRVPTTGWADAGVAFGTLGSAEWRTLDSQYFGVAQRRRRVFLVYRPGGECAGEVLLEPEGVRGNPPASIEAREDVAGTLETRTSAGGFPGTDGAVSGHVVPVPIGLDPELNADEDKIGALNTGSASGGGQLARVATPVEVMPTMRAGTLGTASKNQISGDTRDEYIVPVAFKVRGGKEGGGKGYLGSEDKALTTSTVQEQFLAQPMAFDWTASPSRTMNVGPVAPAMETTKAPAIAFALRGRDDGAQVEISGDTINTLRGAEGGSSRDYIAFDTYNQTVSDVTHTLRDPNGTFGDALPAVATSYAVRRLTPRECERLQAFPDDHTRYTPGGTEIADTRRYRMLGNAVTTTVVRWIGRRLPA